jgi:(1->4)-alpha-D-glucan 1-alpha-D-glucosylmutase
VSIEPRATYRIQLRSGFGFDEAAALVPYLAELGVSHVYLSPILQAASGSTHGYDVVNPHHVSQELGGAQGYSTLCAALDKCGLKQLLDIVPNHMAIAGPENPWWWDLLENGRHSPYAGYFDVEWNPPEPKLRNRVLMPVLGGHYGCVLESGDLKLERTDGWFRVVYGAQSFPLAPHTLHGLLVVAAERCESDELLFIAEALKSQPAALSGDAQETQRQRRSVRILREMLARLLAERPRVIAAINAVVDEINANPDKLDALLESQNYRLAFYRAAQRDLSYRRFFAVNSLVALKTEDMKVFDDLHALPLRWLKEKIIDGVRVDHIDGLRDPEQYLGRLKAQAPHAWVVVEKILEGDERMPASWPVAGTTGYDFLTLVGGLFIDPASEAALTKLYHDFTGEPLSYDAIVLDSKLKVLHELLGSDLNRLTALFLDVCEHRRRHRDYTRHELHETLRAVSAHFPVYRTYARAQDERAPSRDIHYIEQAVGAAKSARSDLDGETFDFFQRILTLEIRGQRETELAMRFQQFTPAVMAKSVEDTAFYCYNRFVALNEVGGDPGRFATSPQDFHRSMAERQECQPFALLTTSTHDTKRSEDVRARLYVLSELPERWQDAVWRWASINQRHWPAKPDRNAEYLLYQTLAGAWPIALDRVLAYMEKAVREASVYTSWHHPSVAYEAGLKDFICGALDDREFVDDLESFVREIIDAGRVNSLAQTLLKLTAPGVPDFYQGSELWDLSLVDPDNRRPVDFDARRRFLGELKLMTVDQAVERSEEGLCKLWLIQRTLSLRRRHPELFGVASSYRPLYAEGRCADNVIAFSRGEALVAAVPRLGLRTGGLWDDTALTLPRSHWRNELTGEQLEGPAIPVARLFDRFPVCLLMAMEN